MAEDGESAETEQPPSPGRLEQFVRAKPIAAVIGAFVIGVIIGRLKLP